MSDPHNNPFVLPGMGQQAEVSGNPLLASMEMMRQAWAGLTGPGGLAGSLPMAPPLNLEDLDRRIAELRSVENWLRMNLSMLSSTIQGMEVQRSTISTLRAFVDSAANMDLGAVGESGAASPLEVALGLKPAPAAKAAGSASDMSGQMGAAAQSASKAWWDLLQQQFNQIAAATAASMPGSPAGPEAPAAKSAVKKTTRKSTASKPTVRRNKPAGNKP